MYCAKKHSETDHAGREDGKGTPPVTDASRGSGNGIGGWHIYRNREELKEKRVQDVEARVCNGTAERGGG